MAEDSRKRRKIHPQPDSFLPSKKPQPRLHVPKFQSAFDTPHSPTSSTKLTTKPPSFPPRPPPAQHSKSVNVRETSNHSSLHPIPIPVHLDPQPTKPTIPMKRHEPPTVPIVSRPATAVKPLSTSSYFMKEPQAPPAPAVKPLLRRALPIPELHPSTDNNREMKPLSTTHFAYLTDASFNEDDDSVDLSALLFRLQEHKAGVQSSEHKPDVLISPQKNKHVRSVVYRPAQIITPDFIGWTGVDSLAAPFSCSKNPIHLFTSGEQTWEASLYSKRPQISLSAFAKLFMQSVPAPTNPVYPLRFAAYSHPPAHSLPGNNWYTSYSNSQMLPNPPPYATRETFRRVLLYISGDLGTK